MSGTVLPRLSMAMSHLLRVDNTTTRYDARPTQFTSNREGCTDDVGQPSHARMWLAVGDWRYGRVGLVGDHGIQSTPRFLTADVTCFPLSFLVSFLAWCLLVGVSNGSFGQRLTFRLSSC